MNNLVITVYIQEVLLTILIIQAHYIMIIYSITRAIVFMDLLLLSDSIIVNPIIICVS
jgi:hypothetical protein